MDTHKTLEEKLKFYSESWFLGALPEQNYLEYKIKWYDQKRGRGISGIAEIAAAIYIWVSGDSGGEAGLGLALMADGCLRWVASDMPIITKERFIHRSGSLFLEIPYNIIKKAYKFLSGESKSDMSETFH